MKSYLFILQVYKCYTSFLGMKKVKITLWAELAHYLSEDVTRKHTVVIITSTLVVNSKFQGNINIFFLQQVCIK
jgi:hypothetical protein